jgi:protein O-mannosyl-transferase
VNSHSLYRVASCLCFFALLICTVYLYWPGLSGPFLLDDFSNIHVAFLDSWDKEKAIFLMTGNTSGVLGRSVSTLSLMFTGLIYGLDPWWFKYHNLMIHLLIGVGLCAFGFKLAAITLPEREAFYISLFCAACWLLHPMLVSTVLYPVQRMAQLSMLWVVYACLSYVYGRLATRLCHKIVWLCFLVPVLGILSVLSKENGALLPLFLLLIEFILISRMVGVTRIDSLARMGLILFPMLMGVVLLGLFWESLIDYSERSFDLTARLLTQSKVMWFYIEQLFWPQLSKMSLYLDYWPTETQLNGGVIFSFLMLFCVLVLGLTYRSSLLGFGILWFLAAHLLESTVIPLEMVFEHRNYLAAWGLFVAFVGVGVKISRRYRGYVLVFSLSLFSFYVYLTSERVEYWSKSESLAAISQAYHPESFRASTELARAAFIAGNYDLGRKQLEKASAIKVNEWGVQLFILVSHCSSAFNSSQLQVELIEKMNSTKVTFYGLIALREMASKMQTGNCPNMTNREYESILSALPRLGVRHPGFYHVMGQIYSSSGYYALAHSYYRLAYDLSPSFSLIKDLILADFQFSHPENAHKFLDKIYSQGYSPGAYEAQQLEEILGDVNKKLTIGE